MIKTIIPLLVQNIPEAIAIFVLVLVFLNKHIKIKTIMPLGVVNGIFVFYVRTLPITFGVHTILYILVCCLELSYIYKIQFLKTIIPVVKTFIILAVYELIVVSTYGYLDLDSFKLEDIGNNPILIGMVSLPHITLILITALIIHFYRNRLIDS